MCSHTQASSVTQTLDELEFERGLWTAVLDNNLEKCQELLKKGQNPSKPDSSGFTPLHYGKIAIFYTEIQALGIPDFVITRSLLPRSHFNEA